MKYVFRISSHFTFYLCRSYIKSESLDLNNCILFLVRNYRIPPKYDDEFPRQIRTEYNIDQKNGRVFAGLNIFKTQRNIAQFDQLVDSYIGEDSFVWYTQVCNDDLCSLMVTKDNCCGYYVIEDGLGSYLPNNPRTFVGWKYWVYKLILNRFFPRIYSVKSWYINSEHPKFRGCIASSQKCFPLHQDSLKVIDVVYDRCELGKTPDVILSVDPLFFFIDNTIVSLVYRDLASYMERKGYNILYYKFHPYFNNQVNLEKRKSYEAMIKKYFKMQVEEISPDFSLENILYTYKCDFYTSRSAVSIYASSMGAPCYSYSRLIEKYDVNYKELRVVENFCFMIDSKTEE